MPRVSGRDIRGTKLKLIQTLSKLNKPISLTTLKNKANLNSVQAMTRHIQYFEEEALITSEYKGKERLISLTNTGKILVA